jgi:hypothetical protein
VSTFEDIVSGLVVHGWHGGWRASYLRMAPRLGIEFNVEDVGIRTWEQLPDEAAREEALVCLFQAYWRNITDQDVRNDLDEKSEFGRASAALRERLGLPGADPSKVMVMVDHQSLAEVLEELDRLRLAARRWPTDTD